MFRLRKYLKNYKKEVFLGPLFKLIEAILELIAPLVMAAIIDNGVRRGDGGYVLRMGGFMVLIAAVGLVCALVCQYFAARASQGFGTELRRALFAKIGTLSHAQIDEFGTPSLITRTTNDVNQLQLAVAMLIRLVVRAPFLVIGATVMSALIDAKISIIFVIAAVGLVLVLYLIMSRSVPFYRSIQALIDRVARITGENLSGARVVRAFARQKQERQRMEQASDDLQKTCVRVGRISALLNPITFMIVNVGIVALLWYGGVQVDAGMLEQGQMIALVNYMTQILLALIVVANLVVIFTKAAASDARVSEVLETEPSLCAPQTTPHEDVHAPAIDVRKLSFAYAKEPVLSDLSFAVRRGARVGIIGGTGSGKSTLAQLIARFYDPTQGEIEIQGVDVREIPFAALRKKIGIVPQKAVLFRGSIRENLKMGNEHAEDEWLWHCLHIAQAEDFVRSLPNGLDSEVQQGGKNFSGGQRQRLTIARALAVRPEILILDDSVSALDYATEAKLLHELKDAQQTILFISQRIHTVRCMDLILVLEQGRLEGMGKHEELLRNCEVYREIAVTQMPEGGADA